MRRLFTSWWFWTGLAVAILVALFLFGLPLVVHFMRPWWVRIAFCVAIVAIWLTIAFFRWRRARRANTAIADELTKADPGDEEEKALARTDEDGDRLAPLRRRFAAQLSVQPAMVRHHRSARCRKDDRNRQFGSQVSIFGTKPQGRRRDSQPRLLVRRRGRSGRYRGALHHAGQRSCSRCGRVEKLPGAAQEVPRSAADQRGHRFDRRR